MEKYEINKYLEKFENSVNDLKLALNQEELEAELKRLNEEMLKEGFWDNSKESSKVINRLKDVKEKVHTINEVITGYQDLLDLYEMYTLEEDEFKEFLEELIISFDKLVEETTIKVILNGKYDD